jgi:hypothetical protein
MASIESAGLALTNERVSIRRRKEHGYAPRAERGLLMVPTRMHNVWMGNKENRFFSPNKPSSGACRTHRESSLQFLELERVFLTKS